MAIIYTYPQLSNPDGTELVVVSETKNQNATRLMTINQIASLVPSGAGGTVTSITLDFDPVAGTDTGLRLWDGAGWVDQQTIATSGSFDVGGTLAADHGGTGQDVYHQGDILYYDATPANLEILTVASAPIGNGDVLTLAGGVPSWATPTTGTMSNWFLQGDGGLNQTIANNTILDVTGGADITTLAGTPALGITIDHNDNVRTETSVTPAQLAHGATFDAITSVTTTATGHLTADTLTTYQLPAGGGTVTSVGATNAMGGSSGITFVTNPVPITGAGTVDLSFGGTIGDMWYADTTASMKLLGIGTSTTNLTTGSVSNQVLAVDSTGTPVPKWTTKEITIQQAGGDIETAPYKINFTGVGVTASSTGPGTVDVDIPGGGGGIVSNSGAFTPVLVNQGIDGTNTLVLEANINYLVQTGSWNIIDRQVYYDFYIEFDLIDPAISTGRGTLGIAALDGEGFLIGLDEIDSTLSTLNTITHNNAGVNICDVEYHLDEGEIGWILMPQNGKLNKFWGMDLGPSGKSVAWLAWNNSQGGTAPDGYYTQYTPPALSTWFWAGELEIGKYILSGSLNPILDID